MIDWLRREAQEPVIELDGRKLPIQLARNRRARRLTMRLAPDGSAVCITLPHWCRSAEAVDFAHARREWLADELARLPQRRDPAREGKLLYRGAEIGVDWRRDAPRKADFNGGMLTLGGPEETLGKRLQRWLEGEALRLFAEEAAHYCARGDLETAEVRLSRARRRWGSCSSQGVLRFNWRLVQAPDPIRRSVVAHEVAHLVHFDHSTAFHTLLGKLYEDDIDMANHWLRHHGRSLYATFG
ncbi:MAG: metal-dependent hydrolase [Sphingomonadaceae bacterium]|nr:metal-dependent hydrolase [Sphingomonadaceae bacterium]